MSVASIDHGIDHGVEQGLSPVSAITDRMPGGIVLSASLHLGIAAAILIGLPTLFRPPPPEDQPIAVELVTIAPDTRATRPNPYRPQKEAKPITATAETPAPKPEPKPEPPLSSPPPPSAAAPPQPTPPTPQPKAADTPPPPPPPPKPVEKLAEKPPPPPIPKPEPKPRPERVARNEPRPEPKPEVKRENAAAFDSLLKNLTKQDTARTEETTPRRPQRFASAEASSQPKAPLGSQLTASELDLIRQQIQQCWVVPAGARDAQDLVIEVKANVNSDGTVQQAWIVDTGRYGADPFFRAAADSAKRAVLNPRCSPLRLPPEKYEAWKNLDLFFNPKDVL